MTSVPETLAIDIGGVIIGKATPEIKRMNSGWAHLLWPQIDGAIDSIGRLVRERFGVERTCLISRAAGVGSKQRLEWLKLHGFYEKTGIRPDRVYFCQAKAPNVPKADLCNEHGVTHIIDNRTRVLEAVQKVPNRILYRPRQLKPQEEVILSRIGPVIVADSWDAIVRSLLPQNA